MKHRSKEAGFSVVELIIVGGVLLLLFLLIVPRWHSFQAKARQSEAKNNLTHIYTLEMAYFESAETYANLPPLGGGAFGGVCNTPNALGFRVSPCGKSRYEYAGSGTNTAFYADAVSKPGLIVSGCASVDSWTIDEAKVLQAGANGAANVAADAVQACND